MRRTSSHVMRHKCYFRRNFYSSFIFALKTKTLKFMKLSRTLARLNSIPISAYFCPEIGKKRLWHIHVFKWLPKFWHAISLLLKFTVKSIFIKILQVCFLQDTIECVCVCVCVCVHACVRACVWWEKNIFSVSFRARIPTVYILVMINLKMTIIQRRLATMSWIPF